MRGSGGKGAVRGSAGSSGILPGPPEGPVEVLPPEVRLRPEALGERAAAASASRPAAAAGLLWGSSAAAVALRAKRERGPGDKLTSESCGYLEMSGTANIVSFSPKCHPRSGR